ncbi:MAG: HDOD domain-containing protein [Aquabacterium sp.]|uniref:HDOD domain-containing protein n=1 Tax=Aquabacterium sp. TaxID=1872578 RepID=UPI0025B857EC|nr:HDOD domain-containing protein [Aquabacterium sp.]MBI5926788.1 HDOD domain-containing protein [Aquabacterium sp.]
MSIAPQLRNLNIDLPACPSTLVKLSLLMAEEDSSIDQLAALIETDMALSSAVVRTVNSALFGLLKRVETVHEGIRYLGMAQVAGLTYEIGLRGAFPPSPLLQKIWDRAGIRGLAMGRIARQLDVDPWQAHTAGLFAETGRAVLYAYDRQRYQELNDQSDESLLCAAEIEAFGVSHSALGAALCQSWGLHRDVSDSVRARPNSPEQWPQERPAVQKLLTIGAAVDALLLNPTSGDNPDEVWHELEPVAHQVGLHFQAFQLATMRVCERLNIPQGDA